MVLYVHTKNNNTIRLIRDRRAQDGHPTFSQLSSSDCSVQCCFTSTETITTIRDRGAKEGHLDFHTAPER